MVVAEQAYPPADCAGESAEPGRDVAARQHGNTGFGRTCAGDGGLLLRLLALGTYLCLAFGPATLDVFEVRDRGCEGEGEEGGQEEEEGCCEMHVGFCPWMALVWDRLVPAPVLEVKGFLEQMPCWYL